MHLVRAQPQLMAFYAQAGRRFAALRQYQACVRALEEVLGVPPSAETMALYEPIQTERAVATERESTLPDEPLQIPSLSSVTEWVGG